MSPQSECSRRSQLEACIIETTPISNALLELFKATIAL